MKLELISLSPRQTFQTGKKLSGILKGGDVLLLSGELGGGKTTFVSGLAAGLNVSGEISSPSFTILNEYRAGKNRLIHADLYRLEDLTEFENIGLDEYLYDNGCIVCVEWGEKLKDSLEKQYLLLDFEYVLDDDSIDKRRIIIKAESPDWEKRLKNFKKTLDRE